VNFSNKKELDFFIQVNGIASITEEIGAFCIDVRPFDNKAQVSNAELADMTKEELIDRIKEDRFSTIYKGARFCFENGRDLASFANLIESNTVEGETSTQLDIEDYLKNDGEE